MVIITSSEVSNTMTFITLINHIYLTCYTITRSRHGHNQLTGNKFLIIRVTISELAYRWLIIQQTKSNADTQRIVTYHTQKVSVCVKYGVNSIPKLELIVNSNSRIGNGIDHLKKWNWSILNWNSSFLQKIKSAN